MIVRMRVHVRFYTMSDDRPLSFFQIAPAMENCRGAAKEMIGDAQTLERVNRLSRSFALYFCAAEKLAKFYTFELAGRRIYRNQPVDWLTFWRKLRGHDDKISAFQVPIRRVAGPNAIADAAWTRAPSAALGANHDDGSLGADWEVSLSATRALARRMLADAEMFGASASEIERALCQAARKDDLATVVNTVVYALEQSREQGCSKTSVIRYLDRIGSTVKASSAPFFAFLARADPAASEGLASLMPKREARRRRRSPRVLKPGRDAL